MSRRLDSRAGAGYAPRRKPAAVLAVLALHVLLVALLWQTLRQRDVNVRREPAPLVWVRAVLTPPPPAPAPTPTPSERRLATSRTRPPIAAPLPVPAVPHESAWVQVPAPPASAASEAAPRLIDTEATRMAIRLSGREALLQERSAQATGIDIDRSDTALAHGVAEAGLGDCMKEGVPGGILGIPLLAVQVARGKCAK